MFRQLILLIFSVLTAQGAFAQDYIELGQLGYRYSFRTESSEEEEGTAVEGMRVNLMLPLKVSENTYLLPGVRFWQYNQQPGPNLRLYIFQLGFQTRLSEKTSWQFLPLFRTGQYGEADFSDGFQVGLLTTFNRQVNERLMLGYGFYTNTELFGQLLTPVLTIDWQISDRWRLFGNFPMYNTLQYDLADKWNTGLNYFGLVTTFSGGETYTERQSVDVAWFLVYYVTHQLVAQVRLGYPVGRSFEEYATGDKMDFSLSLFRFGDDRELLDSFDAASPFVTFNLFFRLKK